MKTHIRGFVAAALLAALSPVTLAQASTPPRPDSAAALAGKHSAAPYQSAFDGYRGYSDLKVQPWRDANDLVGRIGGWQAYARESAGEPASPGHAPHLSGSGGAAAPSAPMVGASAPGAEPVKPPGPAKATPSMPHHPPHDGHVMPKRP